MSIKRIVRTRCIDLYLLSVMVMKLFRPYDGADKDFPEELRNEARLWIEKLRHEFRIGEDLGDERTRGLIDLFASVEFAAHVLEDCVY
jgi:hypothetical protein